jgi:hypothetical protein
LILKKKRWDLAQAAKAWGVSEVQAGNFCRSGRVPGAIKRTEKAWSLPEGTPKPEALKRGRKQPTSIIISEDVKQ